MIEPFRFVMGLGLFVTLILLAWVFSLILPVIMPDIGSLEKWIITLIPVALAFLALYLLIIQSRG